MLDIPEVIGHFGIFHLQSLMVLCMAKFPSNWCRILIIYIAPKPDDCEFKCVTHNSTHKGCFLPNGEKCTHFVYFLETYTLTEQFNLVCDRSILASISQFIFALMNVMGYFIGSNVWHLISPRTLILGGVWCFAVSSIFTGQVFNIEQHLLFKGISSFIAAVISASSHVICAELIDKELRVSALVILEGLKSVGDIILANFSIYFHHWNNLQCFVGLAPLLIFLLRNFLPEAPAWLLRKGKIENVRKLIIKATKLNERTEHIPVDLNHQLVLLAENFINEPKLSQYKNLWKNKKEISNVVLAHLVCSCFLVCYVGLTMTAAQIHIVHFRLAIIYIACSELLGCILALFVSKYYNREEKWSVLAVFNIIGGIILFVSMAFPLEKHNVTHFYVWITVSAILKLCVTFGQCLMLASLTDFALPHLKRTFVFSCIIFSNFSTCMIPYIFILLEYDMKRCVLFFGLLEFVGGILILFLRIPAEHTVQFQETDGNNVSFSPSITQLMKSFSNLDYKSNLKKNEFVTRRKPNDSLINISNRISKNNAELQTNLNDPTDASVLTLDSERTEKSSMEKTNTIEVQTNIEDLGTSSSTNTTRNENEPKRATLFKTFLNPQ